MLLVIGKIVHVIGNVLWIGGGISSAFAFVGLASERPETRRAAASALYKSVLMLVTPGMLLSFGAGLVMLLSYWSDLYAKAPWMHGKLTVGLIAAGFSGVLSGRLRRAAKGEEVSVGSLRLAGAVLALSAVANVILVYLRPGH